jgi:hypothetical protein
VKPSWWRCSKCKKEFCTEKAARNHSRDTHKEGAEVTRIPTRRDLEQRINRVKNILGEFEHEWDDIDQEIIQVLEGNS